MQHRTRYLALTLLCAPTLAGADHIEELVVTGSHDTRTLNIADTVSPSPDVAQLLKKAPGANVNSNGPISGIPQYRGLFGTRIATTLDGTELASAGPNSMDPPLSYTVGGQLESLSVYRGIAPVSAAQESLGGAVVVKTRQADFADAGQSTLDGRVIGNVQSVNDGYHLGGALYGATERQRIKLAAMTESGDDAEFADGEILPTEYERQRYDLGYGFRLGDHTVQLDYGYNDAGDAGTPALAMDIEAIEGDLYRLGYTYEPARALRINATAFASDLDHTMTNYHLRSAPPPAGWRRNTTGADNVGFKFDATWGDERGDWSVGVDGFSAAHDSEINNPNSGMFFVDNFNDAQREIVGLFVERAHAFSDSLRTEFGLRYNRVDMDADEVDGTPAQMMPAAGALRDSFNSADRNKTDDNFDALAKAWYDLNDTSSLYIGVAQKTRSPSYQERYLWLPLEATGGLADGRLYTGNIELDPEISRQIELGLDYSSNKLTLSPRVYYNQVKDYIQGTPSEVAPAVMFVRMMNDMNGTNNEDPLQFNNVDAILYGFDMDWALQLSEHWQLTGLFNYVRGERDDSSDDNLYRIAPPNATARVHYQGHRWNAMVEGVAYADQDDVSATNSEQESDSYEVVNLLFNWQASEQMQLSFGVENLFDKNYAPHLGGYNRAQNPDIAIRERLPAPGINGFARVLYQF